MQLLTAVTGMRDGAPDECKMCHRWLDFAWLLVTCVNCDWTAERIDMCYGVGLDSLCQSHIVWDRTANCGFYATLDFCSRDGAAEAAKHIRALI